jgi:hypothetical protein
MRIKLPVGWLNWNLEEAEGQSTEFIGEILAKDAEGRTGKKILRYGSCTEKLEEELNNIGLGHIW